jgi:hypothetical protein
MRRVTGGDEQDAVEMKAGGGFTRDGEVRVVDGIEGAAEEGDAQAGLNLCVSHSVSPDEQAGVRPGSP